LLLLLLTKQGGKMEFVYYMYCILIASWFLSMMQLQPTLHLLCEPGMLIRRNARLFWLKMLSVQYDK